MRDAVEFFVFSISVTLGDLGQANRLSGAALSSSGNCIALFTIGCAEASKEIFESIEAEIERLKEVKRLLGGEGTGTKGGRKPKAVTKTVGKRTMSAEGRAQVLPLLRKPVGRSKRRPRVRIGSGNQLELCP